MKGFGRLCYMTLSPLERDDELCVCANFRMLHFMKAVGLVKCGCHLINFQSLKLSLKKDPVTVGLHFLFLWMKGLID